MTRQQAIDRWAEVAETVFWAEEAIAKEWEGKLRNAPSLSKAEQHELAHAYCRAIGEEIVSKTTDEELAQLD